MKTFPSNLQQLLSGNGPYLMADCIVIRQAVPTTYLLPGSGSPCSVQTESVGNILLALTNADVDILIQPDNDIPTNCNLLGIYLPQGVPAVRLPSNMPAGSIYCSAIPMDRSKLSLKCGLGVDSIDITLYPRPADSLYGTTLQNAARIGVFDGATVDMFRVFWSRGDNPSGGGVVYFAGRVGEIEFGRSILKLPINSFTELLNLDFPRNVYQPYCYFVLYGAGCCVNKANFTFSGTLGSSPNPTNISFPVSGVSQPDHYFDQGVLAFTSGTLSGLTVTVKSWASGILAPFLPLPSAPAPGDALTLYAGCDRTWTMCQTKFANGANFGGQPFIPIPDTMLAPIVQQSSGAGK